MSHPDELPDLFLDRSLGQKKVPRLLRDAGLRLVTLAEHYGKREAEHVPDVRWIKDATAHGWVLLGKDERIRVNKVERDTIHHAGARYFVLTRQNLAARQQAEWFLNNLSRITRVCGQQQPPFVYAVYEYRIERVL